MIDKINIIIEKYNIDLIAEILPIQTVGVQGDCRTYSLVVNLKGTFPDWSVLQEISTEITNNCNINKITYEMI